MEWTEVEKFETEMDFQASQIKENPYNGLTRLKAQIQSQVRIYIIISTVTVECNLTNESHDHQKDPEHGDDGNCFCWPTENN